jgi:hypothetical protein
MSRGAGRFPVERRQRAGGGEEPSERYQPLAERYRAQAVSAWGRIAHTGLSDTHRYRAQATALREQAARLRFSEIRAQLLTIAEKYESIADFVERGSRARSFRRDLTRNSGNDASRIAPRDVAT